MIRIIAIGKKHEDWTTAGIERYLKRLRKPYDIEWLLLPHSSYDSTQARNEESERILSRIGNDEYVVLLDERGKSWSSELLSKNLEDCFISSRTPLFIIGGAYGVNNALTKRADAVMSLSAMVFPHQMVRLILTEQLYRAQQIAIRAPYHHS